MSQECFDDVGKLKQHLFANETYFHVAHFFYSFIISYNCLQNYEEGFKPYLISYTLQVSFISFCSS